MITIAAMVNLDSPLLTLLLRQSCTMSHKNRILLGACMALTTEELRLLPPSLLQGNVILLPFELELFAPIQSLHQYRCHLRQ
jgi:hypothetical protein